MRSIKSFLFLFSLMLCCKGMAQASVREMPEKFNNYQVDQVISTDEGIFLLIDDRWIGAEGVLAMPNSFLLLENGQWVSLEEVFDCDTYKTWRCRVCGWVNPQGVTKCRNYENHPK
jgi:hypothetical protein